MLFYFILDKDRAFPRTCAPTVGYIYRVSENFILKPKSALTTGYELEDINGVFC